MPFAALLLTFFVLLTSTLTSFSLLVCDCDPRYCSSASCSTDGVCFVSLVRKTRDDGTTLVDRVDRCIHKSYLVPPERPLLCEYNQLQNHTYVSRCCKDRDFCTRDLDIQLAPLPVTEVDSDERVVPLDETTVVLAILLPICCLLFLVLVVVLALNRRYLTKSSPLDPPSGSPLLPCCCLGHYHEVDSCETQSSGISARNAALNEYLPQVSTGSGSGLPLLVQRSVARQISLLSIIGQGRFGEVWKGQWRGENVAVKIFSTLDENSWFREVEIYQTVMLRHPNILGFIAADNKDNGTWTQLWLIMEYMEHGSLFDYLSNNSVDAKTLGTMCTSVATGLTHLHMEIVGTHGKPAIAHRDLKSKNILVRANGSCAIGDLGLAVRFDHDTNILDLPQTGKVGTIRYLAPEVLDESLDRTDFEAFKRADIYALGLVLWEICSRCIVTGQVMTDYILPYSEIVGADPSVEEMRKVVCIDGARPSVPNYWTNNTVLSKMVRLMNECWYEQPMSRVTALRVKKTTTELSDLVERNKNV